MKAFECRMCGTCCYGEGGISVKENEVVRIAGFLGLPPDSFTKKFCIERDGRFSIKTGPDKFCLFYDEKKKCLIHPVKPSPCTQWPFFPAIVRDVDNWEMAKGACPGINPDCSFKEFVKQSRE